jgi:hypothetical protein
MSSNRTAGQLNERGVKTAWGGKWPSWEGIRQGVISAYWFGFFFPELIAGSVGRAGHGSFEGRMN